MCRIEDSACFKTVENKMLNCIPIIVAINIFSYAEFENVLAVPTEEVVEVIDGVVNVHLTFDGNTCLLESIELYSLNKETKNIIDYNNCTTEPIPEKITCQCLNCIKSNIRTNHIRYTQFSGIISERESKN